MNIYYIFHTLWYLLRRHSAYVLNIHYMLFNFVLAPTRWFVKVHRSFRSVYKPSKAIYFKGRTKMTFGIYMFILNISIIIYIETFQNIWTVKQVHVRGEGIDGPSILYLLAKNHKHSKYTCLWNKKYCTDFQYTILGGEGRCVEEGTRVGDWVRDRPPVVLSTSFLLWTLMHQTNNSGLHLVLYEMPI